MSGPIIDLPLLDQYEEEDTSQDLLAAAGTDGTFTTNTGWNTPAPWSIGGGVASTVNGAANNLYTSTHPLTINMPVWIQYDVVGISSGSYTAYAGGTGAGTARTTSGTYKQRIKTSGDDRFYVVNALNTVGSIDNVIIHPALTYTRNVGSLQGRVQLGDGFTAATIPTMIGGGVRGINNGAVSGKWLQWMSPLAAGTYSFVATIRMPWTALAGFLFDARAGGGTGYLWTTGAALQSGDGTIYVDGVPSTALPTGVYIGRLSAPNARIGCAT